MNYMFAEFPENPVLELCWQVLPESYWYGFVMLPFILLLLALIYLPELTKKRVNNR